MREVFRTLTSLGFSEYEARAYCALLDHAPANGYKVAQLSGVPRAKIYETLERLMARGAAVRVETADRGARLYAPTDPRELIRRMERENQRACEEALQALLRYHGDPKVVEVLWRVTSQGDLVERGRALAREARETLHVALWDREFEELLPDLLEAADRGLRMALVLYGPHKGIRKLQDKGVGAVRHGRAKRQAVPLMGRQFVLVADRERCITGSIFEDGRVEGVFTLNRGLVTNAVDLVNHEIYLERIMLECGPPVRERFGRDLGRLDAFDSPLGE
ncbi:MAG: TrmB family transcriptional regulator [Actinobacteria bacterium]|nr:TrmB family transcriptional regulator [Actinomycetota bacterium]